MNMESGVGSKQLADWSQIRETMSMLYLSAAQIESSMREGGEAVHSLTDALIAISNSSDQIQQSIGNLNTTNIDIAKRSNEDINMQIKESVVACQFHDRISQRLEHVTHSLSRVCDLISTPESYEDPSAWESLKLEIRNGYTMESEKLMFEHIMLGMTVHEALEIYHHNFENTPPEDTDDEIELF